MQTKTNMAIAHYLNEPIDRCDFNQWKLMLWSFQRAQFIPTMCNFVHYSCRFSLFNLSKSKNKRTEKKVLMSQITWEIMLKWSNSYLLNSLSMKQLNHKLVLVHLIYSLRLVWQQKCCFSNQYWLPRNVYGLMAG